MTRRGLTARASSLLMPLRSHVPGADDSIHTSEIFHKAISSSTPRACFRSTPIDSLFLATSASSAPCGRGPRVSNGAVVRNESPPARSMWMTSAPNSASFVPMYGWAINTPVPDRAQTGERPELGHQRRCSPAAPGPGSSSGIWPLSSSIRSSLTTSRPSCDTADPLVERSTEPRRRHPTWWRHEHPARRGSSGRPSSQKPSPSLIDISGTSLRVRTISATVSGDTIRPANEAAHRASTSAAVVDGVSGAGGGCARSSPATRRPCRRAARTRPSPAARTALGCRPCGRSARSARSSPRGRRRRG